MFVELLVVVLVDVLGDWFIDCGNAEEPKLLIKNKITPTFVHRLDFKTIDKD
jgi:hypothetical protein